MTGFKGIIDKNNVLQRIVLLLFLYKAFYYIIMMKQGRGNFNNRKDQFYRIIK